MEEGVVIRECPTFDFDEVEVGVDDGAEGEVVTFVEDGCLEDEFTIAIVQSDGVTEFLLEVFFGQELEVFGVFDVSVGGVDAHEDEVVDVIGDLTGMVKSDSIDGIIDE